MVMINSKNISNLHRVKTDMKLKLPRNRNTDSKTKLKSKWDCHNKYYRTKLPTQHKVNDYAYDQLQNISNMLQEQKI